MLENSRGKTSHIILRRKKGGEKRRAKKRDRMAQANLEDTGL